MEMQALIEEIAALAQKIKDGSATLGELEAFAAATNTLNERAIVLRYKAYEAKVYASTGTSTHFDSAQHEPLSDHVESTETSVASASSLTETEETSIEFVSEDEPVLELDASTSSVTEITEEDADLSFDLFSMDDASTGSATELEELIEEEPVAEESVVVIEEEEIETVDTSTGSVTEIEEEEVVAELPDMFDASTGSATTSTSSVDEPIAIIEETIVVQEPVVSSFSDEHPVVRKALTNDGTLQSRLLTVRLETLKSAFGLNERMQIVRELFNGNNEAYSEAIERLDSQSEKNSARSLVNDLAHTYSWDADSEVAVEFVQKVERRYA